jgi:hypothetical protein
VVKGPGESALVSVVIPVLDLRNRRTANYTIVWSSKDEEKTKGSDPAIVDTGFTVQQQQRDDPAFAAPIEYDEAQEEEYQEELIRCCALMSERKYKKLRHIYLRDFGVFGRLMNNAMTEMRMIASARYRTDEERQKQTREDSSSLRRSKSFE